MDGVVAEVEEGEEIEVRDDERLGALRLAEVVERDVALRAVLRAHVEAVEERALYTDRAAELVIAEHVLRRAAGQEHRIDVVFCTYEARGAALEERRLSQRHAEPLFDEDLLRRLHVREARRVEDDARLEAHVEAAEPAEKVRALPADEPVDVGLQRVELEAAAREDGAQLRDLAGDGQRDDARGLELLRVHRDRHGGEHAEVEQRLAGTVEVVARVDVALLHAEDGAQLVLGELLGPLELDGSDACHGAGGDGERHAGGRRSEVDLRCRCTRAPAWPRDASTFTAAFSASSSLSSSRRSALREHAGDGPP